jgi:hypothetical protein
VKTGAPKSAKTQRDGILQRLVDGHGAWVPSPEIAALAQQYNARVYELRRSGFCIESKSETDEETGERNSWFRLVLQPLPAVAVQPADRDWYSDRSTGLPLFDALGVEK